VLPEPKQDVIVAGLLRRLWTTAVDGRGFRPLQAMCDAWVAECDDRLALSPGLLDPGLTRAGIGLLRSLPADASRQVLLCTDLHAENILAANRESWLVIDPKPYLGDPTYDAVQYMLNCDRLFTDPAGLVHRMAVLLDLDRHRLANWLFARCVQESIDQPALCDIAVRLAPG
jgi:streptomycin 6-kinase